MSSRLPRFLFPLIAIAVSLPRLVSAQSDVGELQLGKSIERELKAGETHSLHMTLIAGQYVRGVVEQRGIDVVLTLFGFVRARHKLSRTSATSILLWVITSERSIISTKPCRSGVRWAIAGEKPIP